MPTSSDAPAWAPSALIIGAGGLGHPAALALAAAACAAVALARLPVEAQATVPMPNSMAFETATETTRSLNDSVGKLTASFLTQTSARPRRLASRSARTSGVIPVAWPTAGGPSIGRSSA